VLMMTMRRGGRARLKASDSKSDRGPEGPSGVQILSPPPILVSIAGGVTERPKVRHWKCRARVIPVPWVQIPPPPPNQFDVAVLDGELAVPCSPQSASAGSNPLPRAGRVE
jgi:hypothetical protein